MNQSQQQLQLPAGYVEASSLVEAYSPGPTYSRAEQKALSSAARNSTAPNSPSHLDSTVARPSRTTTTRDGIRGGRRPDNQPGVYRELPSFPKFDEPIPNEASIEEICIRYPNHIRGSYLAAFVQWYWTANDIFKLLTETAKKEFVENGIATCKSRNNRANFLFKRLDAYIQSLGKEEVKALCSAPKLRPCMMDGREVYGKCKLRGLFNNPNAQPIRQFEYTPRGTNKSTALEAADVPQEPEVNSQTLWESMEIFVQYKYAMARHWTKQVGLAQTIINADVFYSQTDIRQRTHGVLQMVRCPINSTTETFMAFQRIEDCPSFAAFVDDKARNMFGRIWACGTSSTSCEVRNKAVDEILREQRHIETTLQRLARLAAPAQQSGDLKFGLVQQAIQAVNNVPAECTSKPGNATEYARTLQQAPTWTDDSKYTVSTGPSLKRAWEDIAVTEVSNKRPKMELAPESTFAGSHMQHIFGSGPRPQIIIAQQAFQPNDNSNIAFQQADLTSMFGGAAAGVGSDFDRELEQVEQLYGTSTAAPAPDYVHVQPNVAGTFIGDPFPREAQNMVSFPGMALVEVFNNTGRVPVPRVQRDDEIPREASDALPTLPPSPSILYDETDFAIPQERHQADSTCFPQDLDMYLNW